MTTPPTERGRATRDRIVAAATAMIYERGVAATSLDDVLAATGTSKSQLYHYFADKSALVHAVIERQVDQVVAAQTADDEPLDSMPLLRAWRDRVVSLTERSGGVGGCPMGRLAGQLAENDSAARHQLDAGFLRWRDLLAAGLHRMADRGELRPGADPDALALGLLAAAQGGLVLAQTARSGQPLATAIDLALEGIEANLAAS